MDQRLSGEHRGVYEFMTSFKCIEDQGAVVPCRDAK